MESRYDVIGMGAALVDILTHADDGVLQHNNLTKGHMHLITALQAAALDAQVPEGQRISGGSAANTTLGVASCGGRAAFLGRVQQDKFGELFSRDMAAQGVAFTNLHGASATPSGCCYSLISDNGERTMCTYLGASGEFDESAVTETVGLEIAASRLLYLEGYIWDTPARAKAADRALHIARAAKRQIGFTLSDGWVADKHRSVFMDYLQSGMVDVLFANEQEIITLTESPDFAAAEARARTLAATVVLTRSEKGAVIWQGETRTAVAATPVAKVVDATGAGDQFAAGFLHAYLQGAPAAAAGQLAAMAAAEVISHIGARPEKPLKDFCAKLGLAA